MDSIGDESIGVREYDFKKHGAEGLIASSAGLGWSGLSAALCAHGRGVIEYKDSEPVAGIFVAISPTNSLVSRLTAGVVDRTIAERGTIWLPPPGPKEVLLDLAAPVPQVLHMYLPAGYFSAESLGIDVGCSAPGSLRYQRSFKDPLVAEIAFAIVSEMRTQTAGGRLLAETLAVSLAAKLVDSHCVLFPGKDLQ